jgi:hypothetical protein
MAACGCSEDVDVGEASCDAHGCCDSVTWSFKNPQQGCDWVSDNTRRCRKISKSDDVPAFKGCPYACGTCATDAWSQLATAQGALATAESDLADAQTDRTVCQGQLAASESNLVDKTNELIACQATDQPTGAPTKSFTILDETATTAQKTECLSAKGQWEGLTDDFCGTCCPQCTAAVVNTSSFTSTFERPGDKGNWNPISASSGCFCVDLTGDAYAYSDNGGILLKPYWQSDVHDNCVRVTGNNNFVQGGYGNDAMYANGVGNTLDGWSGNDHLTAGGSGNRLWGGSDNGGDGDVCTDLSGSNEVTWTCGVTTPNPTPQPPTYTTAEKLECLAPNANWDPQYNGHYNGHYVDYCGTCCPECTRVAGLGDFYYLFEYDTMFEDAWYPKDTSRCVCLDFDGSDFNWNGNGNIHLTDKSDCARITGSHNRIYGDPWGASGDDAIYTNGAYNEIYGEGGDDHIAAAGTYNNIKGGDGYDSCKELCDVQDTYICNNVMDSWDRCEYHPGFHVSHWRKLTETAQLTHAAGTKAPAARA